jgi:hypothetical protein
MHTVALVTIMAADFSVWQEGMEPGADDAEGPGPAPLRTFSRSSPLRWVYRLSSRAWSRARLDWDFRPANNHAREAISAASAA